MEEVGTGIARDTHLREDNCIGAARGGLVNERLYVGAVGAHIGHRHPRGGACHSVKTVFHIRITNKKTNKAGTRYLLPASCLYGELAEKWRAYLSMSFTASLGTISSLKT